MSNNRPFDQTFLQRTFALGSRFNNASQTTITIKSAKNISDLLYPEAENNDAADQPAPAVGTLAPDFEAPNPTGDLVSLK